MLVRVNPSNGLAPGDSYATFWPIGSVARTAVELMIGKLSAARRDADHSSG